jgi:type IV pilus assembly protein PilW
MMYFNHQQGFTMVELLIATMLGLLVVLLVTGLVFSSKSAQSTQIDAATMQDTARFALDNISRSVKQAGYVNLDRGDVPVMDTALLTASVMGLDDGSLKATSYGISSPITARNSSDILALRFFGSNEENTILNCAGSGVPASTSKQELIKEPFWSIYYVSNDVNDEPALYCKYGIKSDNGVTNFTAQAIARGVESFQVLYGLNTSSPTNNHNTTQFLSATQIYALDSGISDAELNKKTHWKKITAIKVAMLIRGAENSRLAQTTATYNLFGKEYGDNFGSSDKGTQINEFDMPLTQRKRLRKVVGTTIQLRNSLSNSMS